MSVVAVAGGTGGLGRSIAEAIKARGKQSVKILGRKANPVLEAKLGIPIIGVDYTDVPALTKTLEENNIGTVVSVLHNTYGEADPDANLILAADASKVTKRYLPSEWGVPLTSEKYDEFPYLKAKLGTWDILSKAKSLEASRVHVGFFLDYWGIPHYPSYLTPFFIGVDLAHNIASIPGKGDTPAVLTHTTTVADYVAEYVDYPEWTENAYIVGDRISMNQLLRIAEEVKGAKFKVTHDSLADLKAGKVTKLPSQLARKNDEMEPMLSVFGIWFEDGTFNMKVERTLNEIFPHVKPLTAKDLLRKAWGIA